MRAKTVNKEAVHLKESGEECMRGFGRKKGREKCNFIIFSRKKLKWQTNPVKEILKHSHTESVA